MIITGYNGVYKRRDFIYGAGTLGVHGYKPTRLYLRLEYSLGLALRNTDVKKRGPDLARRQAKKNTEPRRVLAVGEKFVSRSHFSLKNLVARSSKP